MAKHSALSALLLSVVLSGCATAPKGELSEDQATQQLLSQAASLFAQPNAPKSLILRDEAQVEWRNDKSMKVTVHQLWAARLKPDHPLPPLMTLNQESQSLHIHELRFYDLDGKGGFTNSSAKAELSWTVPEENLPLSLSKITTARLPELSANQALEVKYTMETKTSTLLVDKEVKDGMKKPHPVAVEGSFAFTWNDHVPSHKKTLSLKIPRNIQLYASRLRAPKSMSIVEEKAPENKSVRFTIGAQEPVPFENYQPALQDLAPLTAFTINKSWEDAMLPYRKRVKTALEGDLDPVENLIAEAAGNTSVPLVERLAGVKFAIHQKVDWVDTGLPVYLNPERTIQEIIESGKGTSHDMALLLAAAMKFMKLPYQVYLHRQSTSGALLSDMPALSQMDGVLVTVQVGSGIWMDPTEPLAVPGTLSLPALGQQAVGVLLPLAWKNTPPFGAKDHRKERDVMMEITENGRMKCTVELAAFGSSELSLRQFFRATTDEKRRELVYRGLSKRFPGVILTDYRFGDYRNLSKPLDIHYSFEVPDYAKLAAQKAGIGAAQRQVGFEFFPVVFEDVEDFLSVLRGIRLTPLVVPQNFNSVSRVLVKIPANFKVEERPQDSTLSNGVAEFIASSKLEFGTLTYERYLGLKQRLLSPGKEYEALMDFYQTVLTHDRSPFKIIKSK